MGYAMPVKDSFGGGIGLDQWRAVGITADGKIGRFNGSQGSFAWKKFAARFFSGEAAGEAGQASAAVACILKFLCSEEPVQFVGGVVGEQAFEPAQLDGIEAATTAGQIRRGHSALL